MPSNSGRLSTALFEHFVRTVRLGYGKSTWGEWLDLVLVEEKEQHGQIFQLIPSS